MKIAALAAAASLALLAAGCGDSSSPSGTAQGEGSNNDDARSMTFTITDEGCNPITATTESGPITFRVENKGAAAVTELEIVKGKRILGEVENLADGLSGKFSLTMQPGEYELYCPNGTTNERGTLTADRQHGREQRCCRGEEGRYRVPRVRDRSGSAPRQAVEGLHRRGSRRERRRGEEALPDGARAVRADRAGRRVVR